MTSNFIKKSFAMLISSNPLLGASNVSKDGSSFSIDLNGNGLNIPKSALNTQLSVVSSEIWYNTPNVIAGVNDQIVITYNSNLVVITIPSGLYTIGEIGPTILRELLASNPTNLIVQDIVSNNLIKIEAENNQGKVKITLALTATTTSLIVDLSSTQSIGQMLGFNTTVMAPIYSFSNLDPKFNGFNYYLIQSDMVSSGIRVGPSYNQIIAKVLVQANPNEQVLYQPNIASLVDASNLAGDNRRRYTFRLLDDSYNTIDTRGEYYSIQLRISYYEPINFSVIN